MHIVHNSSYSDRHCQERGEINVDPLYRCDKRDLLSSDVVVGMMTEQHADFRLQVLILSYSIDDRRQRE